MIAYLLDTNAVIALVGGKSSALLDRIDRLERGTLGLSSIVIHELSFGAYRSRKVDFNLETLRLLLADLLVVDFDREDAREAGAIRADLRRRCLPIGPYDVLIAGQARARRLVLVTNNRAEFDRVEGLSVEDWTVT